MAFCLFNFKLIKKIVAEKVNFLALITVDSVFLIHEKCISLINNVIHLFLLVSYIII